MTCEAVPSHMAYDLLRIKHDEAGLLGILSASQHEYSVWQLPPVYHRLPTSKHLQAIFLPHVIDPQVAKPDQRFHLSNN